MHAWTTLDMMAPYYQPGLGRISNLEKKIKAGVLLYYIWSGLTSDD
jgi:hypothetical protein